ncbi:MAG: hypothetical protein J6386_11560 [Candidatus Synoicihabitans palmerolidicus]|nr:hypothetical protein [Candidatus Synoicihabitans palmerolidicus]
MIDLRMRRVRWILGGVILSMVAVGVGGWNSRRCAIVIYNESTVDRAGVSVHGERTVWRVPRLDAERSRRRNVDIKVPASKWVVHLGRAGDVGTEAWFEPAPGRKMIVRIWPDDKVEIQVIEAWWE